METGLVALDAIKRRAMALAELADFLHDNPDLAERIHLPESNRAMIVVDDADELAGIARRLAKGAQLGAVVKDFDDRYATVSRKFAPDVQLDVFAHRDAVCERIVTGTETVEVPDPDAPLITVEREVVEWRCSPLLLENVA